MSQATVSLVINNAPGTRISVATRAAVMAKARELGYRRGGRSVERRPLVAMLINDVTCSPHVAGLIEGVSEAAGELGIGQREQQGRQEGERERQQRCRTGRPRSGTDEDVHAAATVPPMPRATAPRRLRSRRSAAGGCSCVDVPRSSLTPGGRQYDSAFFPDT